MQVKQKQNTKMMTNIDIDQSRMEELTAWASVNDEIRHCHSCNQHYHIDNWVESRYDFDYVCQECGDNYKNSTLLRTITNRTEVD